ncbi:MAG: hypothetical protein WCV80_00410 [Candidatus Paceibacterota bacterium]|jgi:hypothetical protein
MIIKTRTRKVLFSFFIAVFLVIGAYLALKMQGIVVDIEHLRLAKAGGLFFHFTPRDATLSLNGKERMERGSFLNRDIFIDGLAPSTYTASLTREGYGEWHKELTVEPGQVTSASRVVLWPQKIQKEILATSTDAFWTTAQGLLTQKNTKLSINNKIIQGTEVIAHSPTSELIITHEHDTFYFTDLDTTSSTLNINKLFLSLKNRQPATSTSAIIQNIFFHPFNATKLIVITKTSLYLLDMRKIELEELFTTKNIRTYTTTNNGVVIIDDIGTETAINLVIHTTTSYPLALASTARIASSPNGWYVMSLDNKNNLFLFDVGANTTTSLAHNVEFFSFSPDNKRAAFITKDRILSLLYIEEYEENMIHRKGELQTMKIEEAIDPSTFTWIPSSPNYFFIKAGTNLLVEEFDVRPPRNRYIFEKNISSFALSDALFILHKDGTLTRTILEN